MYNTKEKRKRVKLVESGVAVCASISWEKSFLLIESSKFCGAGTLRCRRFINWLIIVIRRMLENFS